MNRKILASTLLSFGVILALAAVLPVQVPTAYGNQPPARHARYKLIDLGTFGGPNSFLPGQFPPAQDVNNRGTVIGAADTPVGDPHCFIDCFVFHAFKWQSGALTDLGVLPGGSVSFPVWISASGRITGNADNGQIDPLTGFPENRAVVWTKSDQIINVGTLGGNESFAASVNDRGEVFGAAANAIPDPFPLFIGAGQETRAFVWQTGVMQDLGTLGGPDAAVFFANDQGQAAGLSFTDATPNPISGIPTVHPFLWENGIMRDLGTLGGVGTLGNFSEEVSVEVNDLNSRGEVAGTSPLAGDQTYHASLWNGTLIDLGTLGGDNSKAYWVNNSSEVAGEADLPGSAVHHAFLWRNGVMSDLGSVGTDPCSNGFVINSRAQIVGTSTDCQGNVLHVFLWQDGGPMIDLNTFVPPGSDLQLSQPVYINDRREITAIGLLPNGDQHVVVLMPCGEGTESCIDAAESARSATGGSAVPSNDGSTTLQSHSTHSGMAAWQERFVQR